MRGAYFKVVNKFLRIIKPIVVSIVSICLVNVFNLFDYITFIPKNISYEFCITAYFSAIEIIIDNLIDMVVDRFKSEVTVMFFNPNTEPSIDTIPIVNFNSMDLADVNIKITIYGNRFAFLGMLLVIPNTNFATIQNNTKYKDLYINEKGDCVIDLYKMFSNTNKKITTSSTFKVSYVKDYVIPEKTIEIYPEIKYNKFNIFRILIKYKCNHINLKALGD